MIYAVMNNNVVENTIVADKKFIDKFYKGAIDITNVEPRPSIGWILENDVWTAPVVEDETFPK